MIINTKNFRLILDDCFGYYSGDRFETPAQVREYLAEMNTALLTGDMEPLTNDELERLGDLAIEYRVHWVPMTLSQLTKKMREYNRTVAPFRECNAWQDYVADCFELPGCAPWDDEHADDELQDDFCEYWIAVADGQSGDYDAESGAHVQH